MLMLHSFGQHIHLAFQQLALLRVAVAQVVPLEALVIGVEVVGDTAGEGCAFACWKITVPQSVRKADLLRREPSMNRCEKEAMGPGLSSQCSLQSANQPGLNADDRTTEKEPVGVANPADCIGAHEVQTAHACCTHSAAIEGTYGVQDCMPGKQRFKGCNCSGIGKLEVASHATAKSTQLQRNGPGQTDNYSEMAHYTDK